MTKNARAGLAKTQRLAGKLRLRNHRAAAGFRKTMSRRTIEILKPTKGNPIILPGGGNVFAVETDFHRMARRPGGVSRQEALKNAIEECQRIARRSRRTGQTP